MDMLRIPSAENWRKIVSRGKYPILFIYELNHGLLNSHKALGLKTKMKNYARLGGASYIFEPEAKKAIEEIRQIIRRNPKRTLGWLSDYYSKFKEFLKLVEKINKKVKNSNLDKSDLKKLFKEYSQRAEIMWRWGYLPFLMDEAIEIELNSLLTSLDKKPKEIPPLIRILSFSPELTLLKQEEFELLKLAEKVKHKGIENYQKQIKAHLYKWDWKNSSWMYVQHFITENMLKNEIMSLAKKAPARFLANQRKLMKQMTKKKRRLLLKIKSKKLIMLSKILAEYNYWHTVKMQQMTKTAFRIRPLFEKLASHLGLTYEEFIELTPEEVELERIDSKKINKRLNDNGVLMINGKTIILTPSEIKKAVKIIEEKFIIPETLKGVVAFSGKASGIVTIVPAGNINISKINFVAGNILVTNMTSTNMMPLIRKASAVVTDEGGLLCHAAIISRELNKPCIIGTKIATKVLKDGQLVEVDANKGMVKILRK